MDEIERGDSEPQVRILGGDSAAGPPTPGPRSVRPWLLPALALIGVGAIFFATTRPAGESSPTTLPPALISAVDAEVVDLDEQEDGALSSDWTQRPVTEPAVINDMIGTRSAFIAVGDSRGSAQAWFTGTGEDWILIDQIDRPEGVTSSLGHVVLYDDDLVALGSVDGAVALWTASVLTHWEYRGTIPEFDGWSITGVAVGRELLAIATTGGRQTAWLSQDAVEWQQVGHSEELAGADIIGVSASADHYFAFGFEGPADLGFGTPVILRSADGLTWERTEFPESGQVVDVATDGETLIAAGLVQTVDGMAIALWRSEDGGASWQPIDEVTDSSRPASLELEVVWARGGANPAARILIDGEEVEVTTGTRIDTSAVSFAIAFIGEEAVEFDFGGRRVRVRMGDAQSQVLHTIPRSASIEGPRVLVAGSVQGDGWQTPAVWASPDDGATWSRHLLTGTGSAGYVGSHGASIVAMGWDGSGWRSTWSDAAAAELARTATLAYVDALATGDADALAALIPQSLDGLENARFQVPSLGRLRMQWWNEAGELDRGRLSDTFDYLRTTNAAITVTGDCTTTVSLGSSDRVNVGCPFQVASELLTAMGFVGSEGRLRTVVRDGVIESTLIEPSPSVAMWESLAAELGLTDTDELNSLQLDAASASAHLAAADQYAARLLAPGETRVVDTPFGPMEWTWVAPSETPIGWAQWISWTKFGFIAVGYEDAGPEPSFTAWQSWDGMDWTTINVPEGAEGAWGLVDFGEGVMGLIWHGEPSLVFYDGSSWELIPVPASTLAGSQPVVLDMTVGDEETLVLMGSWTEVGTQPEGMFMVDADLNTRLVAFPDVGELGTDIQIGLTKSDDGFLLTTHGFSINDPIRVWSLGADDQWQVLSDGVDRSDSLFLWRPQRLGDRYFASGEVAGIECGALSPDCWRYPSIWTSTDAVVWTPVTTVDGERLSTQSIGHGPLGYVTVDEQFTENPLPRAIHMSADGVVWTGIEGIELLSRSGGWWWLGTPAVGTDTIVITGTDSDELQSEAITIIGRLVDG